ncbi:YsnF/AvaK domain-containing protein [Pontibacter liquoris]|uniref:YsnF/AvaK domain-containing protein n=1 Tax=Pontibacter liquoris TaxID=2905677 RepID=UPI001FA7553A|nr:YsnF/AvaK domain-containing protein [Pontibacter liquoris]
MSKSSKKIQSEFEEKLRESMATSANAPIPPQTDDVAARDDIAPRPAEYDTNRQPRSRTEESDIIPVIEENVRIDKRVVETGRVHISKNVHEERVTVDVPTTHEEIDVQRIAVNKYVEAPPEIRYEGDTTIIPVMREEAVVVKRLVLVEELHVTKRVVRTHEPEEVTLRKEEIQVNREDRNSADRPR